MEEKEQKKQQLDEQLTEEANGGGYVTKPRVDTRIKGGIMY
ncbi:MAG: hypothetical protein ACI3Y0_08750 [Prevotella sp.]